MAGASIFAINFAENNMSTDAGFEPDGFGHLQTGPAAGISIQVPTTATPCSLAAFLRKRSHTGTGDGACAAWRASPAPRHT